MNFENPSNKESEEFEVPVLSITPFRVTERITFRERIETLREKYNCPLEKHGEIV